MALSVFTLADLATLDDRRVAAAWIDEINRAVRDCRDRPTEKAVRRVTLTAEIKPGFIDDTGDCEEVKIEFTFKNALPARRTREYAMMPTKNGGLLYNALSPNNARQMTIDEAGNDLHDVKEPE